MPQRIRERFLNDAVSAGFDLDRKSTRLNSSHLVISYAVFCLKKKTHNHTRQPPDRRPSLHTNCNWLPLSLGSRSQVPLVPHLSVVVLHQSVWPACRCLPGTYP